MLREVEELQTKMLDSFLTFEENFQKSVPPGTEGEEEIRIDKWKNDKKKIIREIADVVHDLYGGVHNDALDKINIEEHKDPLSMDWASGVVIPPCTIIARSVRVSASSISSTAAETAPPAPARGLHRVMSDPIYADARRADVDKERNEVWQQAIGERKKFVSFSTCKTWTANELMKHMSQLKSFQSFEPAVGDHHRVFFASSDLLGHETSATPWVTDTDWTDIHKQTFLAATTPTGPGDVSVIFDGGNRTVHRAMEDMVEANKWLHSSMITLVFKAPKKPATGGRLNLFSRQNVENGWVQARFSSNKWKVKERKDFNVAGEADSYDASYSGIPYRSRYSLPLLPLKEREVIVGAAPSPVAGLFNVAERGHPFSWKEKKPIKWYGRLLTDISAGLVIDLTPGSGALARACLEAGIQYVGICRKAEHASWLINVSNRAAVELVTRTGTALYEQDLASCIKDHFKELIEELHAQDAAMSEEEDAQ